MSEVESPNTPPNMNWIKTEPDPDENSDVLTSVCLSNTPIQDETVLHNSPPKWSDIQSLSKMVKIESKIKEEPAAEELAMPEPTIAALDTDMLDFDLDITENLKRDVMTSPDEICLNCSDVASSWNEFEAQISEISQLSTGINQETACPSIITEQGFSAKPRKLVKRFKCPDCKMTFNSPFLVIRVSCPI